MQKFVRGRQQLEAQLTENNIVKEVLDLDYILGWL